MRNIQLILRNIQVLYYVFLVLFVLSIAFEVCPDFVQGFREGRDYAQSSPEGSTPLFTLVSFATTIMLVWSVVLLVRLLTAVGKSIYRKNIFELRIVRLINRYAMIYGIFLILISISMCILPIGTGTTLVEGVQEIATKLMQIVMLLFIGQMLKIGCILKQDQELTI